MVWISCESSAFVLFTSLRLREEVASQRPKQNIDGIRNSAEGKIQLAEMINVCKCKCSVNLESNRGDFRKHLVITFALCLREKEQTHF
jgi:hypothetical protein